MTSGSLWRKPHFWLLAQFAALVLFGFLVNKWECHLYPDSQGYIKISRMPLDEALGSVRTLGFPLLLKGIHLISPNYALLPWMHLSLLFVGVLCYDFCMRRAGLGIWQSFVLSSLFFYGCIQQIWLISSVLSDFSSLMFSGMAIGSIFWIIAERKSWLAWLMMVGCTTLAYHIRPTFVCLIGLIPIFGVLIAYYHAKFHTARWHWVRVCIVSFGINSLLLLSFCAWRWHMVRDFHICSFGGIPKTGFAVEALDEALLTELPPQYAAYAHRVLQNRKRLSPTNSYKGGLILDIRRYDANNSTNIFRNAWPAANELLGETKAVPVNRFMGQFSQEVIRRRLGKYALMVGYSFIWAILKLVTHSWCLIVLLPFMCISYIARRRTCGRAPDTALSFWNREGTFVFGVIAVLYYAANVSIPIISGVFTDSRYVVAAGLFMPCWIGMIIVRDSSVLFEKWRSDKVTPQATRTIP